MKNCSRCGKDKRDSEFAVRTDKPHLLASQCNSCRAAVRKANRTPGCTRDSDRRTHLKGRFGLTQDEYETKLAAQHHLCAICHKGSTKGNMPVDHCHTTGAIRDLLCHGCNMNLGIIENASFMSAAMDYLRKHNAPIVGLLEVILEEKV